MSQQSSAKIVSYNLRISKQCERKMMLDSFSAAMECGLNIPDYRYVGMGGNRFYDFVMMHKMIGVTKMVSLEHDESMLLRAKFNCPFKFIEILNIGPHEFVDNDQSTEKSIYWMDYDSKLNLEIVQDIASIAFVMNLNDFLFVTVCGEPPKGLEDQSNENRLAEIKGLFPNIASTLTKDEMQNSKFSGAVHKMLSVAFKNAFSKKNKGKFYPFFQVRYTDGLKMVTFGGLYANSDTFNQFESRLKIKIPILNECHQNGYKIKRFNLTDKERHLFDAAATASRRNAKEISQLQKLGFNITEIESYKELLRYFPRYVETFV